MYNEEQKQEYIDFSKSNKIGLKNYFNRIGKKEKEYGKDIIDMNDLELRDTLLSLNIRRAESRGHFLSCIRGYYDWAKMRGKTNNTSSLTIINAEGLSKKELIKLQMLKNPDELELALKNSLDFTGYENRSKIYSLVCWLFYFGLEPSQLIHLKKDDIDYNTLRVIALDGRSYVLDNKTADIWKECAEIQFIERKSGKSKTKEILECNLLDNNNLFRPVAGTKWDLEAKYNKNYFYRIVEAVFNDETGRSVQPLTIRNSGIFYRLYQLEISGIEINAEVIANAFQINYDGNNKQKQYNIIRKWRIDYEDWKLAFDYSITR